MSKLTAAFIGAIALLPSSTMAGDLLDFYHYNAGWYYGDVGGPQYAGDLEITIEGVGEQVIDRTDMTYVRATFCNYGSDDFEGGMRISGSPIESAHTTIYVPAGECRRRSEWVVSRDYSVFVYVEQY